MATSRGNMNHSIQLEHHHQHNNQPHHHQNQQQEQQRHQQHQYQIQEHNPYHQNQIPYATMQSSSSSSSIHGNFINEDAGSCDLGELHETLFLYLDEQEPSTMQDQRHNTGMRPLILNVPPSKSLHVEPPSSTKTSTGLISTATSGSKRPLELPMELANATNYASASAPDQPTKAVKRDRNRKGPTSSSEQEGPKTPDPKTLRRLAQNREAARKSRLRKKAYIQQLESSSIRLIQLEQDIQRARAEGMVFGGGNILGEEQGLSVGINNISSEAAVFDTEYTRWLEEHHRLMCELRAAVQEHLPENGLQIFVDNCLAHFDEVMSLKSMLAKTDVFHLLSGMWKTPAERCFMWLGGFRPSELMKVVLNQIEPFTEQQIMDICALQQSTQEAEDAISQGLETLNQSVSDIITSDTLSCPSNMTNYMDQMAIAVNKLSTIEGFVRQAENVRHQTIHRLHQILTTCQAARCMLAIADYFHRLRTLSSLWLARLRQE